MQYSSWQKFSNVINKAKEACLNSGASPEDHFNQVVKMIETGKGAQRKTDDILLSCYACYLIVQNADPSKEIIAQGQTYFAIQTRRQELSDGESIKKLEKRKDSLKSAEMKTY